MTDPIRRVLVAGYGTMGRGVAKSFAEGGFEVTVLTRDSSRIGDLPDGARAVADLPDEPPDLVIENWPEVPETKIELFRRLEAKYGAGPIISTNTSGLPLEDLAAALRHPDRFIGIHYLQPAEAFPCVEVIRVEATRDDVAERAVAALERTGKEVIVLARPIIGFLFNRLQHAVLHEAYWMIQEGLVTAEDVDKYARLALGPRMSVTGLIEQKDIGGLDVHALAQKSIVPALHHGAEPIRFVQEMPTRGELGVKSGKGFYDWRGRDVDAYKRRAADKVRRILAIVRED